jgi:conjugal transfer pilus assembly protein TraV
MSRNRLIAAAVLPGFLGACSTFVPYESDFACKNNDHGRCIHPDAAYAEATTATAEGAVRAGDNGARSDDAAGRRARRDKDRGSLVEASAYAGYQDAVYAQLASLVDAPVTPMLAPAKTIRTLIMPYADERAADRLYMPRYVYSVLEGPRFVLGDYLALPGNDFAGALAGGLFTGPGASGAGARSDEGSIAASARGDEPARSTPRLKPVSSQEDR